MKINCQYISHLCLSFCVVLAFDARADTSRKKLEQDFALNSKKKVAEKETEMINKRKSLHGGGVRSLCEMCTMSRSLVKKGIYNNAEINFTTIIEFTRYSNNIIIEQERASKRDGVKTV
jgi:hypothetical protein